MSAAMITVPSRSEPGREHRVWRERGAWRCSCWGYFYRGRCHHLAQAPALWIEDDTMSTAIAPPPVALGNVETALALGDLSQLNAEDRTRYLLKVCESLQLNPYTRPFQYITLSGRLTLYATRDAADQLRKLHGVSIRIVSRERIDDLYIVQAEASDRTGRVDTSIGAVNLRGKSGDDLANALMRAETKSKRRVTLSICGLGWLDETEVETVPHMAAVEQPAIPALPPAPARQQPETRRPVPAAPAARPDMTDWWRTLINAGWDVPTIQQASTATFKKNVEHLDRDQRAELHGAALSGRLTADGNGTWTITPVGRDEAQDPGGEPLDDAAF